MAWSSGPQMSVEMTRIAVEMTRSGVACCKQPPSTQQCAAPLDAKGEVFEGQESIVTASVKAQSNRDCQHQSIISQGSRPRPLTRA